MNFEDWQPTVEEQTDVVTAAAAAALHDLLDCRGAPPAIGDPLPPLWHWLAFRPRSPQRQLGPDGHPRTGDFLPPIHGRRLFAGARLVFARPLTVGALLHRRSHVSGVERKHGRSGALTFVSVDHDVVDADAHEHGRADGAITEVLDLVYRPPHRHSGNAERAAVPADAVRSRTSWEWGSEITPDATVLFRFSALTYNAHRIHYDRTYATDVEGYPGLVVHGPLQAIALAELCRHNLPDRSMVSFRFRAIRPAFDGRALAFRGRTGGDGRVELVAFDHVGQPTVEAEARLTPAPV